MPDLLMSKITYPFNFTRLYIFSHNISLIFALAIVITGCKQEEKQEISVPEGFEISVFIDSIEGGARHIAVNENGDVYVKLLQPRKGGNVALRDQNGDGKADQIEKFGFYPEQGRYGTAMRIYQGYLYFSSELNIMRVALDPNHLVPTGPIDTIVKDDHAHGTHEHNGKPICFDESGHIYVPYGAPSNACQETNRIPFSKGIMPCPQLADHAGVWRYDAHKLMQTQKDGLHYASGLRSVVGLEWNKSDDQLYVVQHGRDDLFRLWPDRFTSWQSALLPSEEFLMVPAGSHSGWPYCYYDQLQNKKVLAPEYGGDGKLIGGCDTFNQPVIGFPGHWAPNDILFYEGDQFPNRYKGGAFIAFHGSTNRAPYSQSGYCIAFVPQVNGKWSQDFEIFANGFAVLDTLVNVSDAVYRPMGLAVGPDGSLYIAETEIGKIWKVRWKGGPMGTREELASRQAHKNDLTIRTPDEIQDNLDRGKPSEGQKDYVIYCGGCHQSNGLGATGRFPSLVSDWVTGDKNRLIDVIIHGLHGSIEVNGELFSGTMPAHDFLPDDKIASILTYVRQKFGQQSDSISVLEVKNRRALKNQIQ
jgi:glucose/arabinose dehydrogenase